MKHLFPILVVFGMTAFSSCLKSYTCSCTIYAPANNAAPAIGVTMATEYRMVSNKKAIRDCKKEEANHKKTAQPSTTVVCKIE